MIGKTENLLMEQGEKMRRKRGVERRRGEKWGRGRKEMACDPQSLKHSAGPSQMNSLPASTIKGLRAWSSGVWTRLDIC